MSTPPPPQRSSMEHFQLVDLTPTSNIQYAQALENTEGRSTYHQTQSQLQGSVSETSQDEEDQVNSEDVRSPLRGARTEKSTGSVQFARPPAFPSDHKMQRNDIEEGEKYSDQVSPSSLETSSEQREIQRDDEEQERQIENRTRSQMRITMFNDRTEDGPGPSKQPGFDDLFFDLLLTACLSVYSNNADLSSASKVAVFSGYFSLLWWSWWTQTLFDVRYRGRDKVGFYMQCGQRIVRSTLLGVWVAFATVGSEFARGGYTNFTTIYVCSRGALIVDYVLIIVRSYVHKTEFHDEHIPFAAKRRQRSRFSERQCHLIIILGNAISMALWIASPHINGDATLPPAVIGVWLAGIGVELIAQMIVEIFGGLRSISATPIVERLALFSLIVFGNGFENIGQALNQISPGSRDPDSGIPVGGWSSITVLNAAASVVIVMLLFFGYYSRAIKEFVAHPARILIWCYVHIGLHVASAVLMIGLGKVIGYVNTLNALTKFLISPELYLPTDSGWQEYINNGTIYTTLSNDTIPAVFDISDYYTRTVVEIFSVITTVQGAIIPKASLAEALANSTIPFGKGVALPAAAGTQLGNYGNLIQSMQEPDAFSDYLSQNAFNFYYAYLCPAIFLFADVILKLIQHSANGFRSMGRQIIISQSIRFFFAVLLAIVQVIYYLQINSISASDAAVLDCLIILACILMFESILQTILLFLPTFHKIYIRCLGRRKRR